MDPGFGGAGPADALGAAAAPVLEGDVVGNGFVVALEDAFGKALGDLFAEVVGVVDAAGVEAVGRGVGEGVRDGVGDGEGHPVTLNGALPVVSAAGVPLPLPSSRYAYTVCTTHEALLGTRNVAVAWQGGPLCRFACPSSCAPGGFPDPGPAASHQ
ncbi:MAG: hypothetical protein LC750_05825 [Actinobacteria bacterium]|nr:hypothetical protein [Actinomycetota bacterium]